MNFHRITENWRWHWHWHFVVGLAVGFVARIRIHELHHAHQGNTICYTAQWKRKYFNFWNTGKRIVFKISVYLHEGRCIQIALSAQFLWILDFEEEIQVANQDADQRICAATGQYQIEAQQNPWQIHGLEACAEPKVHNDIFIQLAPDV